MTQFTRVFLNPRNRTTRSVLASQERLHAIIARATAEDVGTMSHGDAAIPSSVGETGATMSQGRCLWRLDRGADHHSLYIVSAGVPDVHILKDQVDIEGVDIATCEYDPFLLRLATGQEWQFRLRANPTSSIPSGKHGIRGTRKGILNKDKQIAWLLSKARNYGFHIPINRLEVPEIRVSDSRSVDFNRRGSVVTFAAAVFDGYLAVDDPVALRSALTQGIGRGKGYGFGLLTLAPIPRGVRPKETMETLQAGERHG